MANNTPIDLDVAKTEVPLFDFDASLASSSVCLSREGSSAEFYEHKLPLPPSLEGVDPLPEIREAMHHYMKGAALYPKVQIVVVSDAVYVFAKKEFSRPESVDPLEFLLELAFSLSEHVEEYGAATRMGLICNTVVDEAGLPVGVAYASLDGTGNVFISDITDVGGVVSFGDIREMEFTDE